MGGARTGTTGTFQRKCLDFLIFQQTPNTLYIRYCKWRQRSETLTIGWISICGILDCFPTLVFYYSPITLSHIFTQHAFVFTIFWLRSTNHSYRFYELNTPLMEEYSIDLLHGARMRSRRLLRDAAACICSSVTCRHIAMFFQAPVAPAAGTVHTPYASLPQACMHARTRCQW
jgi:uncharacterized membrane protein YbhN (UPF0104 family)